MESLRTTKRHLLLWAGILWGTLLYAQTVDPLETYMEQTGMSEEAEEGGMADLYEQLEELSSQPLDLNNATREELEQLPFLTYQQLNDLLEYRHSVKAIHSWQELSLCGKFTPRTIQWLQAFTYLGAEKQIKPQLTWREIAQYARQEAVGYFKIPCYSRKGDDHAYAGDPYKHWFRYSFRYKQTVQAAFVGSQDAGEPFFSAPNHMGYDFYSFYVLLRNQGWLKAAVVGRFKLRTGMGLVMNNYNSFGKLANLEQLGRSSGILAGYSSRSEAYYLQGAAATFQLTRQLDFTAFASYRSMDATLNKDSLTVATLIRSGYHRTATELKKKNNTDQSVVGGHLSWRRQSLQLGLTALYTTFNRRLRPNTNTLYRRYAPQEREFGNASVNYAYTTGHYALAGEVAVDQQGYWATINKASFHLPNELSLTLVHRYYDYHYQALLSNSFGTNTSVNNEHGVYVGMQWNIWAHTQLIAYTDYAYFPWARYGVSTHSQAWDHYLAYRYQRGASTYDIRYHMRSKELDDKAKTDTKTVTSHRLQASFTTRMGQIESKTLAQVVCYDDVQQKWGWTAGQQMGYKGKGWQVWLSGNYFQTHDYNSRVYVYERNLTYTYSYPYCYGKGVRGVLSTSYTLPGQLTLSARATSTRFFDREVISSGYQQIDGRAQTDVEMQLRYRF